MHSRLTHEDFSGILKKNGRYLAWKSWDQLFQQNWNGGVGFRYAKDYNRALLAKLSSMIDIKRDSLCTRVLRSKYEVCNDWLQGNHQNLDPQFRKALKKQNL